MAETTFTLMNSGLVALQYFQDGVSQDTRLSRSNEVKEFQQVVATMDFKTRPTTSHPLIVVEGLDGSGKTTLAKALADKLRTLI
jgi:adenylylsulfate kinase-like enzyme